jgi:hypothetical protein
MSEANRDPQPLVPCLFEYPIDGRQVMCERLYETTEGVYVRILDGDECNRQPYLISKRYYAAIVPMERVMPGITPPCNCNPENQAPAVPSTMPQA